MSDAHEQVVYIVDDDQGMLDSTVWLLESVGLSARPFTGGREFLEACNGADNACVLLDVRMPGMGGLQVQEAMRARAAVARDLRQWPCRCAYRGSRLQGRRGGFHREALQRAIAAR